MSGCTSFKIAAPHHRLRAEAAHHIAVGEPLLPYPTGQHSPTHGRGASSALRIYRSAVCTRLSSRGRGDHHIRTSFEALADVEIYSACADRANAISPLPTACATACSRVAALSFLRALERCSATVGTEMDKARAIPALSKPLASPSRHWTSRGERGRTFCKMRSPPS